MEMEPLISNLLNLIKKNVEFYDTVRIIVILRIVFDNDD